MNQKVFEEEKAINALDSQMQRQGNIMVMTGHSLSLMLMAHGIKKIDVRYCRHTGAPGVERNENFSRLGKLIQESELKHPKKHLIIHFQVTLPTNPDLKNKLIEYYTERYPDKTAFIQQLADKCNDLPIGALVGCMMVDNDGIMISTDRTIEEELCAVRKIYFKGKSENEDMLIIKPTKVAPYSNVIPLAKDFETQQITLSQYNYQTRQILHTKFPTSVISYQAPFLRNIDYYEIEQIRYQDNDTLLPPGQKFLVKMMLRSMFKEFIQSPITTAQVDTATEGTEQGT